MRLMAEVYNAYAVGRVLRTRRQGWLFSALHIAESTVLDIHLSNAERLYYSNMCCSSLNSVDNHDLHGNKTSHFFMQRLVALTFRC